jgi:glutathione S-transferase
MAPARPSPLALAGSLGATFARLGAGIATRPRAIQPDPLPVLYEFEGCPFCRVVREAITELDLDVEIRPCPKGGERFRPELVARGGEAQFPYLVDAASGVELYESLDIVRHLFTVYGDGELPLRWRFGGLQQAGSALAGLWRPGAGRRARPSLRPEQPLELYSFEGSPYARLVRERLCELELPYVLRSVGRARAADWVPPPLRDALAIESEPGTANRTALLARAGRVSVPYLVDPNTGVEMAESSDILDYLERTWAA